MGTYKKNQKAQMNTQNQT